MTEEEQPPHDYFPLDDLSVQMQLGIYEYADGWTANELRKVDRLRRQIVDGNPRIFEKKRMIPSVIVENGCEKGNICKVTIPEDYCKCYPYPYNQVVLIFEDMSCVALKKCCGYCERDHFRDISSSSPIIGSSLEECCHFVGKGSKIGKLTLKGVISNTFVQSVQYFIDSSIHLELTDCEFESAELFKNLVEGPRCLRLRCGNDELLNDEFFRNAGRRTLEVHRYMRKVNPLLQLTDDQLAILVNRNDLADIRLNFVCGITGEGVRRAVQALLLGTVPKVIEFSCRNLEEFHRVLRRDSDGIGRYPYTFGGGKVTVEVSYHKVRIATVSKP